MSKDYRLTVLRKAAKGSLPREIDAKGKYAHLLATCVELEESGHLKVGR